MTGLWGQRQTKTPRSMSSIGTLGVFRQSLAVRWSERPWPGAPWGSDPPRIRPSGSLQGAEAGPRNFRVVDNTSAEPSSGAMNPKPFSALNHFTVPCGIFRTFLLCYRVRSADCFGKPGPFRLTHPSWSRRNSPDYRPRRNRDRNVDPASVEPRAQELRPPHIQPCRWNLQQSPKAAGEQFTAATTSPLSIARRGVTRMASFGRELLEAALSAAGTPEGESPLSPQPRNPAP